MLPILQMAVIPFAFSIFAIAFSVGMVSGSAFGGSLIHTYELRRDGTHRLSEGVLNWWIFDRIPIFITLSYWYISFFSFGFTAIYVYDVDKSPTIKNSNSTTRTIESQNDDQNGLHKSMTWKDPNHYQWYLWMAEFCGGGDSKYNAMEMSSSSLSIIKIYYRIILWLRALREQYNGYKCVA